MDWLVWCCVAISLKSNKFHMFIVLIYAYEFTTENFVLILTVFVGLCLTKLVNASHCIHLLSFVLGFYNDCMFIDNIGNVLKIGRCGVHPVKTASCKTAVYPRAVKSNWPCDNFPWNRKHCIPSPACLKRLNRCCSKRWVP